jgi:hypothetical protein
MNSGYLGSNRSSAVEKTGKAFSVWPLSHMYPLVNTDEHRSSMY